jgi:ring-1,2-phenylacetyl-CoA epoxidase subunit PaaD
VVNALAPISADQVYAWLQEVPDPEIPVLSVVDLGVVRDVSWDGEACVVVITPTYSGCPAMREITQDIQQTLARHGIDEVRVETRLAPAWTTDWMSEKGREALKGYGIAAPAERAIDISGISRRAAAPAIACPRCGSRDTRMVSNFGSTSCKALYRCVACREPFDYFKTH